MPCATIHMMTAGRALATWDRRPRWAPFDPAGREQRQAFLLGAMGPDMGFVPGVERLVSELAHYVSTGDLVRQILAEARTPTQRAFAWGWATHHVTDVEIHPVVGRACGDHLLGDADTRMNASEDLEAHVAMEVGLDLVFLLGDDAIPRPPRSPCFGPEDMAFLRRALAGTYGIPWQEGLLERSHRTATLRTGRWPTALTLLGRAREFADRRAGRRPLDSLLGAAVRLAGHLVPSGSALSGFLRPLVPPAWAVERVREVADTFAERFQELVDGNLTGLENRNLETGRMEDAPVEHPDSARTIRRLSELRTQAQRQGERSAQRSPSTASSHGPSPASPASRA